MMRGSVAKVVAAAAGLLLAAGCTSGSTPSAKPPSDRAGETSRDPAGGDAAEPAADPIVWTDCAGGFQCGTLQVPLDHAKPDGPKIKLAVIRKPATGSNRIGSLVLNPGGPGGSGLDYAQYAAVSYPADLRKRFDIVGFDPRGVGRSTAIDCLTDNAMDTFTQLDATPDTPDEVKAWTDATRAYGQGCADKSGDLLAHVSTVDAARDMDLLRGALGDAKLYYVGASYGTFLGATYAELFPKRVGRLVLDGAMDPSQSAADANRAQGGGFETALNAFLDNCVAGGSCPLGADRARALTRIRDLLTQLDARPLPGDATRKVTESIATTGILSPLYSKSQWPTLRKALEAALRGDGSDLLDLNDQYYERGPDGKYKNLMYANTAVNCLDGPPAATSKADVESQLPTYQAASPTFGRNLAWAGLSCTAWPVAPTGKPHEIKAEGADPILVVGTTRDPATPYAWAQALAGQLASGTLLTYDGDGHTAFGRGSNCIDRAVVDYLLQGTVPPNTKTCR
ncbi:alpha/beta hydrolase [Streptomyces sp. SID3343]|uniref:alpha/beta hydrolase n=1 Tax=Streptomyces sp. SID3343 TaxID=2690260 RepID=UPI00136CB40F|nr:alpha/beta hydrolase [Streptomyces sp. SID3343]MYW00582.1 alpha/beta fold hydrolase [Streptomyces sp. SID3343]